jgi:hypothetical protein
MTQKERKDPMYRFIYLMALTLSLAGGLLASCNTRRDDPRSEADKEAGRSLKAPGDSVRLEDTLSIPPAGKDTTRKGQ